MKNLKHHKNDCFEFYKTVCDKKKNSSKDPTYKQRIKSSEGRIQLRFKTFDTQFGINRLENINSLGFTSETKSDFIKLYSYSSEVMQKLKVEVTTTEENRVINTCQYCTINEATSFDHYLPKEEFPEFSVNPKNLIPSCPNCNGYKGVNWRNGDKRNFINLYLDLLPQERYLFVTTVISKKNIDLSFELKKPVNLSNTYFETIQEHYKRLHLFDRFRDNIDLVVTPLVSSVKPYIGKLPFDEIKECTVETSLRNMVAFGSNYWKSIIELNLIDDANFINFYLYDR